jgi:predicted dehydrogenase
MSGTTRLVRIGFIGCGGHATSSLYPTFRLGVTRRTSLGDPVGELVACCDLDEDRARQNARTFGFERWYTDHRTMLEAEQLDCVFVVMPPQLQAPLAIECLSAGLPVFVEKPATATLEDVYAERVSRGAGLDGYALTLRFASGGLGLINVNCLEGEHNNWSERPAVTGVGGRVFVENWRRVIGFPPDDPQTYFWEPEDIRPADDQNSLAVHGFVGELRDFAQSVRDGRPPACTIDDGIAALRLERAVDLSVERGTRVRLADALDGA